MIRYSASSSSGYKSSLSSYNWAHPASEPNDVKNLFGIVVGVAIYSGSVTVSSVTIVPTAGGATRSLRQIPNVARTWNGLHLDAWHLPNILPDGYTVEVTLSGSANSSTHANSYAFFGGFGLVDGSIGTGTGVYASSSFQKENSFIYLAFVSDALTGITDSFPGQERRQTTESASGSHCTSDKGPINPVPEEGEEIGFGGAGAGDDYVIIYLELLNNNIIAPAIG